MMRCFLFLLVILAATHRLPGQTLPDCDHLYHGLRKTVLDSLRSRQVDTILWFHADIFGNPPVKDSVAQISNNNLVIWRQNGQTYKSFYKADTAVYAGVPGGSQLLDYFFDKNISNPERQEVIQRYYFGWPVSRPQPYDDFYSVSIYTGKGCFYQMLYEREMKSRRTRFARYFGPEQKWFKRLLKEIDK